MLPSSDESDVQFQLYFLDCDSDSIIRLSNDKSIMNHLFRSATNKVHKFEKIYQRKESNRVTDIDQLSLSYNPTSFSSKTTTRHPSIEITKNENSKISIPIIKSESSTQSPSLIEVKTDTKVLIPKAPPLPNSFDLAIKSQSKSLKTALISPNQETLWSKSTSFLPVGRSMESTKFDPAKDDGYAITMLDCDQNSDKEIFYDPINSDSIFNFGSVEIADFMTNIQEQPTFDFDLSPASPPMKKPRKKKQNRILSNLPHIDVREWFVTDETSGRSRRPLLHEFLRQLLNNKNYSHIATYIDRSKGIFRFYQKNTAAELWQRVKGRNSDSVMTYEKLARAIRYYYSSGIIHPTPGRFTFQFGIILAFNKRSPIEIAEAIKTFNLELISVELIQHLIQYIPNDTEIDAFRHLSIDKEQLSPADRLMYEIIQIPLYMERLNTIKFKLIFADNYHLLNDQMHVINEACSFLYQSNHIKKLLEIILSIVNHLNPTIIHQVLTLDDLSKIYDLKTSKTHIPIMNIVSEICNDRHSEIFDIKENYKSILSASKIDLTLIKSEIEQMKQEFEQIELWINKFEGNIQIQKFLHDCQHKLHEIIQYYEITNDQFHKTVSYFTKEITTSTRFFSIFANLIHSLKIKHPTL
ncbi:unnamed protein product [Rotaria sordida]|uniref:Uncharacterized protein n=1 Tax=Rotaria sordida TaxID=392033 RepID=A0A813YM03_9BILA|nr:unnamed protein product [Rotaria sordida]